jgi:hypothetical protein
MDKGQKKKTKHIANNQHNKLKSIKNNCPIVINVNKNEVDSNKLINIHYNIGYQ